MQTHFVIEFLDVVPFMKEKQRKKQKKKKTKKNKK